MEKALEKNEEFIGILFIMENRRRGRWKVTISCEEENERK